MKVEKGRTEEGLLTLPGGGGGRGQGRDEQGNSGNTVGKTSIRNSRTRKINTH